MGELDEVRKFQAWLRDVSQTSGVLEATVEWLRERHLDDIAFEEARAGAFAATRALMVSALTLGALLDGVEFARPLVAGLDDGGEPLIF